jgi:aminocarboxymuconate-semialdehyde decarboxylase
VRSELRSAPSDPFAYGGRIFTDTITHDPQALRFLIAQVGIDNIVLGTDMPADMATPDPIGALREVVDEAGIKIITEDNPARLYPFGGA